MSDSTDFEDDETQDDDISPGGLQDEIEIGESRLDPIIEDWEAHRRSQLLNASVTAKPKDFKWGETPPPESCADYDGLSYPLLDRDGMLDPQLLWGSYMLAGQELPEKNPTRRLLVQLAQKHRIGPYNDEWKSSPPTPVFLLARETAIGVVKRFREVYSPKPMITNSNITESHMSTQSGQEDFLAHERIRIKPDTTTEQLLRIIISEVADLQKQTFSPAQRLGIESVLRLLKKGVYVK